MTTSRSSRAGSPRPAAPLGGLAVAALVVGVTAACGGSSAGSASASGTGAARVAAGAGSGSGAGAGGVSTAAFALRSGYLVAPNGRTVYEFSADSGTHSRCNSDCRQEWQPVTSGATPHGSSGVTGMFGRTAGNQVTYAGHPLYYFVGDKAPGDTHGQGLVDYGGRWSEVAANGSPVGGSASSGSGSGSTGGGGYGSGGYGYSTGG